MTINLREISFKILGAFKEGFKERFKDIGTNVIVLSTVRDGQQINYGIALDRLEILMSMFLVDLMEHMLEVVATRQPPQQSQTPMTDMRKIKEMIHNEVSTQVGNIMALQDMGVSRMTKKEVNEFLFRKRRSPCP